MHTAIMPKCLLCSTTITRANDSGEHLLCNGLGGQRKVRGLVCQHCNSTTGHTWDAALGDQLLPLTLMFGVSRQRKSALRSLPVTTTAGERITIGPGGKLSLSEPVFDSTPTSDGKTFYRLIARTMAEARTMVGWLKRKHPEIDVEAVLAQAQAAQSYPEGAVCHDLSIGGERAGRSIVKSCLALAFDSGIPLAFCGLSIGYLLRSEAEPPFGFYQERDLVTGRVAGTPLHCLAVKADPVSGLVLAYAEFFGCHRIVACLGERYSGPFIERVYALDPRDGKVLDLRVDLPFERSDLRDIYDYKCIAPADQERAMDAVIGPAIRRSREAERNRVMRDAWEGALTACGAKPGDDLTDELRGRIARSIAERVTPFVLHQITRPRIDR